MEQWQQKGFTLIEVMITVAIIGILAAVATPLFNNYKLNSRTVEAKMNLEAIATSQIAYLAEYNTYRICAANPGAGVPGVHKAPWDVGTNFDVIGFAPKDSDVHYQYAVAAGAAGITLSFVGTATGNLDGDGDNAVFQTTENLPVSQTPATVGFY